MIDGVTWSDGCAPQRHATDVPSAIALGDEIIRAGLMRHVVGEHMLENRRLFYRFAEDEDGSTR